MREYEKLKKEWESNKRNGNKDIYLFIKKFIGKEKNNKL